MATFVGAEHTFNVPRFRVKESLAEIIQPVRQASHQGIGAIGGKDRYVNRCRMVGHAEATGFRFVLRIVEPYHARNGARYHTERVLEHHFIHGTAQSERR